MKKISVFVFGFLLFLVGPGVSAAAGSGQVKIGYTFLDEEGNQSVNHSTYNRYEGFGLSLERFRYHFDNGIRLNADLRNITLNNRNLNLGIEKSGHFGISFFNNQYRRTYDFDGNSFIRRHRTGGSVRIFPHRYLKVFGGGEYAGRSGKAASLFDLSGVAPPVEVDYGQFSYNVGLTVNYQGRMFQAEYVGADYADNENPGRDQSRSKVRLFGSLPVPNYERLVLSGAFHHFETRYNTPDYGISSNRVRGGALMKLAEKFSVNYYFVFDRTTSDSDFIATDNITHTFYGSHFWPGLAGVTVGYQYGINDDYEDAIKSSSFYFGGWLKPCPQVEFRVQHGIRSESVDEGSRLIGDEDRDRFRFTARYKNVEYGSISFSVEDKNRKNDQLRSESDFSRISIDGNLKLRELGSLSGGYSFSKGEYENNEQDFAFDDHLVFGDIELKGWCNLTPAFGVVYYRSKRDLDVESFTLRFKAAYRFMEDYVLDVTYNVNNFDDFLVKDRYYTANIVDVSIKRMLSF